MKVKNKIIAIILSAVILSNMMPATTAWAAVGDIFMDTTVDGHVLTYKVLTEDSITSTGTVQVGEGEYMHPAISGTGYGSLTIPQTVVKNGITYTVTSIGDYTFDGCSGFTGSLTIPDSVTYIGCLAFQYCGFTGSLTIPNYVTFIGEGAFARCNGFTGSLTIPGNVTFIGICAFGDSTGFTGDLVIPDSVEIIADSAFENCSGLGGSLTIGNGVKTIGDYAFYRCSFTGNLAIPDSVQTIGEKAFRECTGFDGTLAIGNSVTSIGVDAFGKCSNLTGNLIIPGSVQTIGDLAFNECTGFTGSLTIGDSVQTIGNNAFTSSNLTGNLIIPDSVQTIGDLAFGGCVGFGGLTIGNSVQTIGNSAFSGCYSFTGDLVIPDSVTSIGDYAFNECTGFNSSLTIGNNVQTIGNDAFYFCIGFTGGLTIPDSVETIGNNAFYGCYGFDGSLIIGDSVQTIGNDTFYFCSQLSGNLIIPHNVETIGNEAFMNCYGLNGSLTIEHGVRTIGQSAFQSCSGFTGGLTIPDSVTSIGGYAFFSNNGLDGKLTLGNHMQAIGGSAFSDCTNLDNAWFLGDKPSNFGNSVFDNCKSGFTLYHPQGNSTWNGYTYDGEDTIYIEAIIAPEITTTELPNGTVGVEYNYSLEATGNDPIVWILSSGSLPDGVDLESDGDLSGTPTAAGTFNFSVTATNATGNDTQALSIVIGSAAPVTTYTITATAGSGGSISPNGSVGVTEGSNQTFTITPDSGYRINSVTVDGVDQGAITTYTFMNVTGGHTINAIFTSTSGGDGGGSSTPSTPTTPDYNAGIKAGNVSDSTLPITINTENGTASIDIGSQKLTSGETVITIPSIPDVDTYSVGIPVPSLSTIDGQGTLTLDTDAGSITIPSNMLTGVSGISGSKTEITIGEGNKSGLPEDVKAAIGDRPLVQLTLSVDGKQTDWSNPNAPVTVSIPYTPTAAELANPESIVIWYIDGSGHVVTIPNGFYDPDTGMVTFSTTHFSLYAVAYNKVSFNDVAAGAWYNKAVSFIAARSITTGTGNGNYSPDSRLTRGEFIVLMMRAYGIAPDENPTDNFSDAGNTYYTGYLAAAKRLGISAGVGNKFYAPGKEITRLEMFTLLYNALRVIDQLPQGNSGKTLSDFSDARLIDAWALDAMKLLVETGVIRGSAGKLAPASTTTRAEIAQVLYNLMSK